MAGCRQQLLCLQLGDIVSKVGEKRLLSENGATIESQRHRLQLSEFAIMAVFIIGNMMMLMGHDVDG
jgi:hypothetical protein